MRSDGVTVQDRNSGLKGLAAKYTGALGLPRASHVKPPWSLGNQESSGIPYQLVIWPQARTANLPQFRAGPKKKGRLRSISNISEASWCCVLHKRPFRGYLCIAWLFHMLSVQ
jgi:hypothetical protein